MDDRTARARRRPHDEPALLRVLQSSAELSRTVRRPHNGRIQSTARHRDDVASGRRDRSPRHSCSRAACWAPGGINGTLHLRRIRSQLHGSRLRFDARERAIRGRKARAAFSGPPVFYISRESHLAWVKIGHQAGIGRGQPLGRSRRTAAGGWTLHALARMIDDDVAQGNVPVMIVATAGTTNAGMIDPLRERSEDCARVRAVAPRGRGVGRRGPRLGAPARCLVGHRAGAIRSPSTPTSGSRRRWAAECSSPGIPRSCRGPFRSRRSSCPRTPPRSTPTSPRHNGRADFSACACSFPCRRGLVRLCAARRARRRSHRQWLRDAAESDGLARSPTTRHSQCSASSRPPARPMPARSAACAGVRAAHGSPRRSTKGVT